MSSHLEGKYVAGKSTTRQDDNFTSFTSFDWIKQAELISIARGCLLR